MYRLFASTVPSYIRDFSSFRLWHTEAGPRNSLPWISKDHSTYDINSLLWTLIDWCMCHLWVGILKDHCQLTYILLVDQCNVKCICGYEYLCCFMSFWYKLEPFGRRKLRLRNCLHLTALWANPLSIFLIGYWRRKRRPSSLWVVVTLGKWTWVLPASRLTMRGKSISSTSSVALLQCLSPCFCPLWVPSLISLTDRAWPDSHISW